MGAVDVAWQGGRLSQMWTRGTYAEKLHILQMSFMHDALSK